MNKIRDLKQLPEWLNLEIDFEETEEELELLLTEYISLMGKDIKKSLVIEFAKAIVLTEYKLEYAKKLNDV